MRAVLCDDLTGAFDVAEHALDLFAAIRVVPFAWEGDWPDDVGADDLLVLSSGTRDLPEAEALVRVRAIASRLESSGIPLVFKKIDSTLRGAVRVELDALPGSFGVPLLLPAHPALGRTVVDGRLLVDGIPVEATAFGRDPAFPKGIRRVADLLPARGGTCPDARSVDDLARAAIKAVAGAMLPAGSSGFCRALLERIHAMRGRHPAKGGAPPRRTRKPIALPRPALFVNGSRHPVSADDEAEFARDGAALPLGTPAPPAGDLALATRALPGYAGLAAHAAALLPLLTGERFPAVVVSGGATLEELIRLLSPASFTVTGSVAPGLPAVACAHRGGAFTLVPKPGGFPLRARGAAAAVPSPTRKADAS